MFRMASKSAAAAESTHVESTLVLNDDFVVELNKKGKHSSNAWKYFGNLRNKETNTIYDENYYFCKICVEEKHLLTTK